MNLNVKKVKIITDNRGWLAEIIRPDIVNNKHLGLVLVTTAKPGMIKGNHYHKRKKEWYFVVKGRGLLKVWSKDKTQEESMEIGEKNMVLAEIPTYYFHSIQNIGKGEMILIAYVDEPFSPKDPDTYYE